MTKEQPRFTLEFYEEDGMEPVLRWMREDLSASERRALGLAMHYYLQSEGADLSANKALCEPVGDGVFEFKLRYPLKALTSRLGIPYKKTGPEDDQRLMLRVFFHQHESRVILLLHGYDKGKNLGKRHQQAQIQLAKDRKAKWLARQTKEQAPAQTPSGSKKSRKGASRKSK